VRTSHVPEDYEPINEELDACLDFFDETTGAIIE